LRLQISFQTFEVLTLRYVKWFNFHRAVSAHRIKEANPALGFGLPVLIFSVIIAFIRSGIYCDEHAPIQSNKNAAAATDVHPFIRWRARNIARS
jgi:hypothetical protein